MNFNLTHSKIFFLINYIYKKFRCSGMGTCRHSQDLLEQGGKI